MASNCNSTMKDFVSDSQNFILRLSGDSIIEDTQDLVTINNKIKDKDNIIIISDSSCSSSPEYDGKSKWKFNSNKNKNEKYQKLYFLETSSSESGQEKSNLPCESIVRSNNNSPDRKYINKTTTQINKALSYTSDETASNGSINHDRKDQINKYNDKKSYESPILMFPEKKKTNSKTEQKYNIKKANDVIMPNHATYNDSSNVLNRINKFPAYYTPQLNKIGKIKLTKQDTHKILKNIKSTQVVYDSPREKKESNVIIDESTDEDVIHPAISPSYNKKIKHNNSLDVIDTSLKDNIVNSQMDLLKPYKTYSKFLDILRKRDLHESLSEKKKRQIVEWLINSPDALSDSSCSNIPLSIRNSIDSGNSSLERLELNYETPNNRGRINKVQTDKKQTTIVNSDKVINSFLTRQTTIDQYFKNSNNDISKFCTPTKPKSLLKVDTDKKISSSVVNTPEQTDIMNCVDILDKLYGNSWRDKANAILPTTEPRKTSNQTINRIIQTERRPISKNKYYITDSDSDKSALVKNNVKLNRRRNIQQKQRKQDSFINDESLSSSDNESLYHTALTNPRTSTNSTVSKPMPDSIKRLQVICDTDTEDENDKSSSSKKNLNRRLSFSDDESSNTSEFDPGDYIPPKSISKKVIRTTLQSKFRSIATDKSVEYKSFLTSLSSTIPISKTHPDAKKYRLDYKNNKEELCKELYKLYNEKVFDNQLPQDIPIEWSIRLRGSAGYCYNKKIVKTLSGVIRSSRIVLGTKILDTPDRLRDTLIHEMCHAATWLINNVSDGHGPFWTKWAHKAMKIFPELPPISRCHNYEIKTKYTYRCTGCGYSIGRHSKSLDVEKKRCGHCLGKFELLINKTTKSGIKQVQTPKREPSGFALYVKQNYNSVKKEKNNIKHADVMKILGQQFSAIKIAKNDNISSN
ncbi:germ cell nuclear acidic protein-like isoform X2 [Cataglyphis hispanica]|uniref:germ cell nuclear acidic protein-like isoform X2 n=1 Tax=Cataglyphis hispanica TaxID=1086592 RepID=UPI00218053C9|nr:germ cell nuclear acidic protein-like isoform X2 [Cataglyphis hispanica]